MAKKKEDNEELIVDVQEVYSKTETYVEENKNILVGIVAVIAIVVGAYFAYNSFYLKPLQDEANEAIFFAEKNFAMDSLNTAIYGNENGAGFIEIADEYGSTKAGDLANYYLGISFLRIGEFQSAIEALDQFSGDDEMLGTIAIGAQGDALVELGEYDKAADKYKKAANRRENEFTTPLYLMKAGKTYELLNDYSAALEVYKTIKKDWKKSPEASDIEKYIARAEATN